MTATAVQCSCLNDRSDCTTRVSSAPSLHVECARLALSIRRCAPEVIHAYESVGMPRFENIPIQ